jgi:hypothetical protein
MQESKDIKTSFLTQGLNQDIHPSLLKEGQYTSAINAKLSSHLGDAFFIQNEPSNFKCLDLAFTLIGHIKIEDSKYVIFSTNDFNSEIGVFNPLECKYTTLVKSTCLGFNKSNLIRGVYKTNADCTTTVYWTDGLNPIRYLNIDNIPYKYTVEDDVCQTKTYTNELDCEALRLFGKVEYPELSVELGTDGTIKNGTYQACIAYSEKGMRVTDFMGITLPLKVFSHENKGYSLDVTIDNLDRNFSEYELAIIYRLDGVTSVDKIGYYSTAQNKVTVTTVGQGAVNNSPLTLGEVTTQRPFYDTADDVVATSNNLFWISPTTRKELDYQKQAMAIKTKWVAYKVPPKYYRNSGSKVGYMRDEVYAFGIQWLYDTGHWTPVYHIPGRKATNGETSYAGGGDAYEGQIDTCDEPEKAKYWQVYNTGKITKIHSGFFGNCDEGVVAEGDMAYWESSEKYTDNEYLFGDDSCKAIRHHRMPDSSIIHTHDNDINNKDPHPIILGVKFDNIEKPKDENGVALSNVVGYRILRSDRRGNKTIVGKGLLFNTGSYEDNGEKYIYPNYPYNDLRTDPFLSKTKTKLNLSGEQGYTPLGTYSHTKFTMHSPSFSFNNPTFGTELKVETEEIATVNGKFSKVYKHPKYKFFTNFAVGVALAIGIGEAAIAVFGKKCVYAGNFPGGMDGVPRPFNYAVECQTALVGRKGLPGVALPIPNFAAIGLAMGFYISQGTQAVMMLMKALTNFQDFAWQYNSHGFYGGYDSVDIGNKRRYINDIQYLIPGIQQVGDVKVNNFEREGSVLLELHRPLLKTKHGDNTRNTISGFGMCNNPEGNIVSQAVSYYASIKRKIKNQYGQLDSINYLDTGNLHYITDSEYQTSDVIFGGDTYVTRFTVKRKLSYFNQRLFDVPDGFEFNYMDYYNIAYPRYWINGQEYDFQEVTQLKIPSSRHNMDCRSSSGRLFSVKDRYFYMSNNGIVDFLCESEYNTDYRDWDDTINGRHFDIRSYTDLKDLFRQDRHGYDNKYLYDRSYLKQLEETFVAKQSKDFNPAVWDACYTKFSNRIIYSLGADETVNKDNWLVYLHNNYHEGAGEGNLTTVRNFSKDALIFLYDKGSPFVTMPVDTLQTDLNLKITLGDGGLFERAPQPLLFTENGYGSSQSKWSWITTQYGSFYPSQRQGRVFLFNGQSLEDISRQGMETWFKKNLPSKLLKQIPNYKHKDNPIKGVGLLSSWDNEDELYYLTKIDWRIADNRIAGTTYNEEEDLFYYNGVPFELGNSFLFEDASWTISFSPKTKTWISFHDWHPNWTISTESHFMTYKDRSLWKHNELCNSFNNYYGEQKPWELELVINNQGQTMILGNLEWNMEAFKYHDDCYSPYHVLDHNFDQVMIYNTEQNSGLLKLNKRSRNQVFSDYPIINATSVDVEYAKVEQSYRLNQFFDLTKDRGEFSGQELEMWDWMPNGYRKVVKKNYLNYGKNQYERKKFRHNYHKVILRRTENDDVKMIFRFNKSKNLNSFR